MSPYQASFEEREEETCQLFDRRQRNCTEEMEGLKQRCATKLRQVSQMASKTQQALELQVNQLQVSPPVTGIHPSDNLSPLGRGGGDGDGGIRLPTLSEESLFVQAEREKLQGDVSKLSQEKGLVELRLRSYQTQNTRLAPTLEETQWEVSEDSPSTTTSGSWGLLTPLSGGR